MNLKENMKMGAGIMLVCKDKTLVLKRALYKKDRYAGYWNFPGGMAEEGETPYETALREVFEETKIPAEEIMVVDHVSNKAYTMFIGVVKAEHIPILDHEHTKYKWIDIESVPKIENLHPKDEKCFSIFLSKSPNLKL